MSSLTAIATLHSGCTTQVVAVPVGSVDTKVDTTGHPGTTPAGGFA